MLKRAFNLYSTYQEAKAHAAEQSANFVERDDRPWLALFCIALTVFFWVGAVTTSIGPVETFQTFGFPATLAILVVSYFSFFLGSKFVFKPTQEELADDTSVLAIFSACERRSTRSLISIGLAFFHTLIFVGYLISKDQELLDSLSGLR